MRFRVLVRGAILVGALAVPMSGVAAPALAQQVSCGQVITEDTTLENDLSCSGGFLADGIIIGASGITLDLGGHRVYADHVAVLNEGHDRVIIRNGAVAGEYYSIRLDGANRNTIADVEVGGFQAGIWAADSDRTQIVSNTLADVGIDLVDGSDHSTVVGNAVRGREGIIIVRNSSYDRIVENGVTGTDGPPISVGDSDHVRIARNTVVSDFEGITLRDSDENEVVDNVGRPEGALVGFARGVEVHGSSRNVIRRNVFVGKRVGAWVTSGEANVFADNRALAGTTRLGPGESDGFRVESAAIGTVLRGNTANGNPDDGIDVESPGTALLHNTANDNGDLGIEAVPGVFAVGNRASSNGNPLQCLNVICR
jgi:parallel beta-helix repeat protein